MKFVILFGLVVGNFLWAYFDGHQYARALDRSFFQAVAIWVVALNRGAE